MFQLKTISQSGIPRALERADRYRLLNEPREAESICRDVLRIDADHQVALRTMILALTEQFGAGVQVNITHAQELLPRLQSEFDRTYLAGVICERWAKCQFRDDAPGNVVYDWFIQAMGWFERAEPLSEPGDEDARLRWNACARMIKRYGTVHPRAEDTVSDDWLQDDVPVR
ncbi:MAG: hypothetical protein HKO59_10435 [Phycisphaerales bacterium]|nr:hypothetical protein [Phycisphaerae bacterium]NNF44328.1 hypothetical protein [Phycisphaerales bacterium]NNM26380.1 hypothetical protein [Phycisphaerales bacterium]